MAPTVKYCDNQHIEHQLAKRLLSTNIHPHSTFRNRQRRGGVPEIIADPGTSECGTGSIPLKTVFSNDPGVLWRTRTSNERKERRNEIVLIVREGAYPKGKREPYES